MARLGAGGSEGAKAEEEIARSGYIVGLVSFNKQVFFLRDPAGDWRRGNKEALVYSFDHGRIFSGIRRRERGAILVQDHFLVFRCTFVRCA